MCTLSWTRSGDGYWVFFNRDERVTRAPGLPPSSTTIDGVEALAPRDGDFGGTWIGVNHFGMVAALLNRYEDAPADPAEGLVPVSRGLLIQSLLDAPTAAALTARLAALDLRSYRPFTIGAFDRGGIVRVSDWNGAELTTSETDRLGMVRTSSGSVQREAEEARAAAFAALVGDRAVTAEQLREFHRSHVPARGPLSVCMHREEAQTQSLTEIRVTSRTATMKYWAGSPCLAAGALVRRIPVFEPPSAT